MWEGDRYGEDHDPWFRVSSHKGIHSETGGWTTVYDITGADVLQAIDWAQRRML